MSGKVIPVEDVCVGELIRFTPGYGPIDQVLKVHLRFDSQFPDDPMLSWVTVTHQTGAWSKHPGEKVEVIGRRDK